MGAKTIKGITVEINGKTTGLIESMKDITSQGIRINKELGQINKALKLDPGNVELLTQKQTILADAIANVKEELQALEDAQEQVDAQYASGDIDRGAYLEFQNKVIIARKRLKDLETQADETAAEIKKIDEKPVEEVEDAAEQAEDALKDAGKQASTFGDVLKAGSIIEGAKGIAEAVNNIVEETNEYRKIMGTLKVSSEDAGYAADETQEAYKRLYGVLGDEQAAATTLANLQALQLPQEELLELIDNTTGAWAKYGDSIPIDGLAESVNETARAGQVTGTFADVLNWGSKEGETFGVMLKENIQFTKKTERQLKGMTEAQREEYEATKAQYEAIEDWNKRVSEATTAEDYFNLALEACADETERTNLVMQAMKDQGLGPLADAWRETNDDIVAANETQADFSEKTAEMAERVAPVVNEVKEDVTELVDVLLEATEGVNYEGMANSVSDAFGAIKDVVKFLVDNGSTVMGVISAIVGGLIALKGMSFVSKIAGALKGVTTLTGAMSGLAGAFPALSGAFSFLSNPIGIAVAAIGAIIAVIVYLWNTNEDFRKAVVEIWENIKAKVSDFCKGIAEGWDGLKSGLGKLKDNFTKNHENIKMTVSTAMENVRNTCSTKIENARTNMSKSLENIKSSFSTKMGEARTTVSNAMENVRGTFATKIESGRAAVSQGLENIKNGFSTKMSEAHATASAYMENVRGTFASKIESGRASVSQGLSNIAGHFSTKMSQAHATASTYMENVRGTFASKIESGRASISQGLNNIASYFSTKLSEARSTVSSVMDNIAGAFSEKIEAARSAVANGIQKIKDAFNFSVKFDLKLPHVSVSGGVAPYGIGGKGSLPKFSVSWYKEGGILNGAQIFGTLGKKLLGGGEAGPEAVLPLRTFYAELDRILTKALNAPDRGPSQFNQYNTYNSPKDLSPAECARQTRNETRKLLAAVKRT